jgi:hypothetical protein
LCGSAAHQNQAAGAAKGVKSMELDGTITIGSPVLLVIRRPEDPDGLG